MKLFAFLCLSCFLIGCSSKKESSSAQTSGRGSVKNYSALPTLTCLETNYKVNTHKISYETVGVDGSSKVNASAAVLIPEFPLGGKSNAQTLMYFHGTIFERADAPSEFKDDSSLGNLEFATSPACSGFVVVLPDYLGLGEDTTQMHPHSHAKSLASASIDALRAAQSFLRNEKNISINATNLFLTGFSEGGYATMVTHKEIQENHGADFIVKASYPIAGNFDLSGTMYSAVINSSSPFTDTTTDGDTLHGIAFLPYIFLTYLNTGSRTDSISDILIDGLSDIHSKYDMNTSQDDITTYINSALSSDKQDILKEIIKPDYITQLEANANHSLRQYLAENDAYKWRPETRMLMISCDGDNIVPPANMDVAYNYMKNTAGSTTVEKQLLTADSHVDCLTPAVTVIYNDIVNLLGFSKMTINSVRVSD